jgi:hypothetical protein
MPCRKQAGRGNPFLLGDETPQPLRLFYVVIQRDGLPYVLLWRVYLGSVRRWPLQLAVFDPI